MIGPDALNTMEHSNTNILSQITMILGKEFSGKRAQIEKAQNP